MRLILAIIILCAVARADTKITWLADVTADRAETVTGAQSNQIHDAAAHIVRGDNPHSVTAVQIGAITAEADPVAGPRLDLIEHATNKWNAAYAWGDHALAGYLLPAALAPYATTAALAVHTNRIDNPHNVTAVQLGAITAEQDPVANAALVVHTNRADNPHGVTAVQIGALTAEQDLAALRAYHYGSPDIVESPAGWFVFDAGTILMFNWEAGRENVVIPWEIGGVPVTAIGANAFHEIYSYEGYPVVSVVAPQTVTVIGSSVFDNCNALASINLPQVTSIGVGAFFGCNALTTVNLPQVTLIGYNAFLGCLTLTSVHMGQNAPAEAANVFTGITPPPTVYVTDPQATGWGAEWNGAPVVRPPLYGSNVTAQAFTLGGDTITEWPAGGGGATNITDGVTSGTYSGATRTFDISAITQRTVKLTNGTTMADGVYNTTNGVFFTKLGTNYWILLD